ncbi:type II toxin-antitoxin system HicB family antitoxin [Flavobacterium piscis]|uniref:RNase H-like HicB family nuclease n=1 Tax=Flavobacterium piscis TaxID=1114874 RepID=A0ABU1YC64_9FLAO|nr:type II toxin-antitoxin system HicB family antitoxin [Flavobacterium piscis]MDR7211006.1 putative RNase H-like HicB family nuclease [Flavobacterium piscis]
MKTIKIIIERNEDGFWGYAENEKAIVGGGDTVQECKQDILDCIETLKELDEDNRPAFLEKEYELVYKFDTASLLNYYKGIFTNSALERITGINQKQIQHYASGHRNPRLAQRIKIENALHNLGKELLAVEL